MLYAVVAVARSLRLFLNVLPGNFAVEVGQGQTGASLCVLTNLRHFVLKVLTASRCSVRYIVYRQRASACYVKITL